MFVGHTYVSLQTFFFYRIHSITLPFNRNLLVTNICEQNHFWNQNLFIITITWNVLWKFTQLTHPICHYLITTIKWADNQMYVFGTLINVIFLI